MIVPVHIGGYPVDMDPIMELAKKHNILVLEDAAHAFGAVYKGRMVGTIGGFGAYSFHEVKNCTSFGEGGILTTNIFLLPCILCSNAEKAHLLVGKNYLAFAREVKQTGRGSSSKM